MIEIPKEHHRHLPLDKYYKFVNMIGTEYYVKLISNVSHKSEIIYDAEVIGELSPNGDLKEYGYEGILITLYTQEIHKMVSKGVGWQMPKIYILSDNDIITEILPVII